MYDFTYVYGTKSELLKKLILVFVDTLESVLSEGIK